MLVTRGLSFRDFHCAMFWQLPTKIFSNYYSNSRRMLILKMVLLSGFEVLDCLSRTCIRLIRSRNWIGWWSLRKADEFLFLCCFFLLLLWENCPHYPCEVSGKRRAWKQTIDRITNRANPVTFSCSYVVVNQVYRRSCCLCFPLLTEFSTFLNYLLYNFWVFLKHPALKSFTTRIVNSYYNHEDRSNFRITYIIRTYIPPNINQIWIIHNICTTIAVGFKENTDSLLVSNPASLSMTIV